jgi:hypothetical protein
MPGTSSSVADAGWRDVDERLRRLAGWLGRLESPDFVLGRWAGGERRPDGVITMPYYELSPEGREFVAALPVEPFAWTEWLETDEGRRLRQDRAAVAGASAAQLVKLTTAIVRSERFADGSIESAFNSGLLTAIVRRANDLTAQGLTLG